MHTAVETTIYLQTGEPVSNHSEDSLIKFTTSVVMSDTMVLIWTQTKPWNIAAHHKPICHQCTLTIVAASLSKEATTSSTFSGCHYPM